MQQRTSRVKCVHGNILCEKCVTPSDAAKRFADGINALLSFNKPWEIARQWVAVNLQDGSVDSSLYDSRADAVRLTEHPDTCFYFPIGNFGGGVSVMSAEIMLLAQRDAYDAGLRITDGHDHDLLVSTETGDKYAELLMKGLRRND